MKLNWDLLRGENLLHPVTPAQNEGVTAKHAHLQVVTPVTPVTPTKHNKQQTASSHWRLYFHGLPAVEYVCCPPATLAEMLDRHSLATHAEPFDPVIRRPDAPLSDDETEAIRRYCMAEDCQADEVDNILTQCQNDADARLYFIDAATAK